MINEFWFDVHPLDTIQKNYSWLANLPSQVKRVANFGCSSGDEPFTFLWFLNAKEVVVVEKEENCIEQLKEKIDRINNSHPESLQDRTINPFWRDMTRTLPELPNNYFDLAYCKDVLYILHIHGGMQELEIGILQMIRVVKPNGFIIADESNYGAEFSTEKSMDLGIDLPTGIRKSDPKDMSNLFSSKGLRKLEIQGCPPYAYCYQKTKNLSQF